jgi:hypothetical protein
MVIFVCCCIPHDSADRARREAARSCGCGQAIYRASLILQARSDHPNSLPVAMEQPSPLTVDERVPVHTVGAKRAAVPRESATGSGWWHMQGG